MRASLDEGHPDSPSRSSPPPLKVAVVTETWPPEVNGVAATLWRVVQGLRARGHQLQLVRPRQHAQDHAMQESHDGEFLLRGLPIPGYPQLKLGLPARRALKRAWSEQRPDIVHVVTEGPLGWSALQAAQDLELPVVSDFRTNFHAYSRHYGLSFLHKPILAYLRRFHNRTVATMVPTQSLRAELAKDGFAGLCVVARGVDTRLFDPARRSISLRNSWGLGQGDLAVLCVGRLAAEKNLQLLVRAFNAMAVHSPRAQLVLVGEGPEQAALQQQCPQAVFAGLRRAEDLASHYASADLFLFPSVTETFGNVVPEAMASGLPVLAFNYAAPGQLIQHGANGMLVSMGDEAGFVSSAARLASQPAWLKSMGHQARLSARGLGWERIVQQVEDVYASAIRSVALRRSASVVGQDAAALAHAPRPRRSPTAVPVSLTRTPRWQQQGGKLHSASPHQGHRVCCDDLLAQTDLSVDVEVRTPPAHPCHLGPSACGPRPHVEPARQPPFVPGALGINRVERADGRVEQLGHIGSVEMAPGGGEQGRAAWSGERAGSQALQARDALT